MTRFIAETGLRFIRMIIVLLIVIGTLAGPVIAGTVTWALPPR